MVTDCIAPIFEASIGWCMMFVYCEFYADVEGKSSGAALGSTCGNTGLGSTAVGLGGLFGRTSSTLSFGISNCVKQLQSQL